MFARLLDAERGGHFAVRPLGPFSAQTSYVGDSGVLRAVFQTDGGAATLTDFMPVRSPSGPDLFSQVETLHRLVRLVEGTTGSAAIDINFRPRPNYGRTKTRMDAKSDHVAVALGDGKRLLLRSSVPLMINDG